MITVDKTEEREIEEETAEVETQRKNNKKKRFL
jgi:hypothetical protein